MVYTRDDYLKAKQLPPISSATTYLHRAVDRRIEEIASSETTPDGTQCLVIGPFGKGTDEEVEAFANALRFAADSCPHIEHVWSVQPHEITNPRNESCGRIVFKVECSFDSHAKNMRSERKERRDLVRSILYGALVLFDVLMIYGTWTSLAENPANVIGYLLLLLILLLLLMRWGFGFEAYFSAWRSERRSNKSRWN